MFKVNNKDTRRSIHQRCSVKKGVLQNFANFTGKQLCLESLFNKVAGPRTRNFIKKRLQHKYFPVKFEKFLRTSILKNIFGRLLLYDYKSPFTY